MQMTLSCIILEKVVITMVKSKDEVLFDAICQVRSDVLHASNSRRKLFKHKRKKYDPNDEMMIGMAIVVLTGILILVSSVHSIITKVNQRTQYEEGGEKIVSLNEVEMNDWTYSKRDTYIDSQYVSDFLVSVTSDDLDVTFDIYEIEGISKNCAVAIKENKSDEYYIFNNTEYAPETLGQLVEDLSLEENLVFEEVYVRDGIGNEHLCEYYDEENLFDYIFKVNYKSEVMEICEYIQNIIIDSSYERLKDFHISIKISNDGKMWLSLFSGEYMYEISNVEEINKILNKVN